MGLRFGLSVAPPFGLECLKTLAGLRPPTMPSADFWRAITNSCESVSSSRCSKADYSRTHARPPRLSSSTFTTHQPDLLHKHLMDGGLRCDWPTRPTCTAYYPIPVRPVAALLHASFRPRLATTPLRFANPSPPSSWIRDLHPQVGKHAWQT